MYMHRIFLAHTALDMLSKIEEARSEHLNAENFDVNFADSNHILFFERFIEII